MPCPQWNDDWIAHLYDELSAEETLALTAHLEACASCEEELARLAECREWIGRNAPAVPASPRVIVLQPQRSNRGWLGFAAGLAAAVVVFAAGLAAAPRWLPSAGDPASDVRDGVEQASTRDLVTLDRLDDALHEIDSRIDAYEARLEQAASAEREPEQTWVSRQRLEEEFQAMQAAWNRQRALDMQTVFRELALTEEATQSRLQEHMLAIRLQSDPRISEK